MQRLITLLTHFPEPQVRMVFRWDNHPLREAPHLLVELREIGYIEARFGVRGLGFGV